MSLDRRQPIILAIDDTPANLKVLSVALSYDFQVQIATSGAIGLAAARKAPPDLILLDVMMPVMDGFEVCRQLKADPALQHIPVIFLTALSAGASESEGLKLGAADYITKPINVEIARLRIANLLERESLRQALAHERDKLTQSVIQLEQAAQQLQEARLRELEIGNAIQRDLLQGELPLGVDGVNLASLSKPSQVVDGDFSVMHRLQADCFDILVGDVMGKGVPAALIGAGILSTYHQVLAELLLNSPDRQTLPTPAQMVNQLHQLLTPRLVELATFATLALYRFDLGTHTLTYVNAGHTPGLLLRAQQASAMPLPAENLPIGILPTEIYTQSEIALLAGDRFLLFSDGITETRNAQGEEFGLSRLAALFESWPGDGPCTCKARLESVSQTLQRYADNAYVMDDQSMLLVELLARQPHGA